MKNLMAEVTLRFAVTLPDDEDRADEAFDHICEKLHQTAEDAMLMYTVSDSFSIKDANTFLPEE